jgi:hypothetical protein
LAKLRRPIKSKIEITKFSKRMARKWKKCHFPPFSKISLPTSSIEIPQQIERNNL